MSSASAVTPGGSAAEAPLNRTMITLSIMLATIIQALDGTIANVALPHMQGSLSASQDQITWVLTSFIVAAAIATLAEWGAEREGHGDRPVHRACGTPVETRPWCPTCDAVVDDGDGDDLVWG